jgi:hypothetical protein
MRKEAGAWSFPHLLLIPRLRRSGAAPALLHVFSWRVKTVKLSQYKSVQALRIPGFDAPTIHRQHMKVVKSIAQNTGHFHPQETYVVLISFTGWVDPVAIVRPEGFLSVLRDIFIFHIYQRQILWNLNSSEKIKQELQPLNFYCNLIKLLLLRGIRRPCAWKGLRQAAEYDMNYD